MSSTGKRLLSGVHRRAPLFRSLMRAPDPFAPVHRVRGTYARTACGLHIHGSWKRVESTEATAQRCMRPGCAQASTQTKELSP
jgi:hypothetical protein